MTGPLSFPPMVSQSGASSRRQREMIYVDATCPLVSKVHIEAQRHADNGLQMIMIGHAGHPETVGTMGQLPEGEVLLVETVEDVATVEDDPDKLAFATKTTYPSMIPQILWPHRHVSPISSARRRLLRHNQPEAVKAMAPKCDAMLVVGAPNSSNSKRLVEVGAKAGCQYAQLVQRATDIDWRALEGIRSMGITAGASAPEVLINEVIDAFSDHYDVTVDGRDRKENVEFKVRASCENRPDPGCATGMSDYHTFQGRVEPMEWGKSVYTVLRCRPTLPTRSKPKGPSGSKAE